MAYIGPAPRFGDHQKQVIIGDSSTVTFTLDYYVTDANSLMVIYNGVIQEPGTGKSYTTSGNSITFSVAPTTGSTCWIIFLGIRYDVGTVADGAITKAKLDSAVASPILLATVTASASATIDFDSGVDWTAYSVYMFELIGVRPTTDDVELWVRVSTDGGSTYKSGATDYRWSMSGTRTASTVTGGSSGATSAVIGGESGATQALSNASTDSWCGRLWLYEMNVAATTTRWCGVSTSKSAVGSFQEFQFGGQYETGGVTDGFQFILESGTIASGTFKLYGLL